MKVIGLLLLFPFSLKAQNNNPVVVITSPDMSSEAGCWATLYEEEDFQGSNITLFNGDDIPDLEYSTGPYWSEKLRSITVGSTARVILFPKENYQGMNYIVPPSSKLSPLPWEEVKSLKISCISIKQQQQEKKKGRTNP